MLQLQQLGLLLVREREFDPGVLEWDENLKPEAAVAFGRLYEVAVQERVVVDCLGQSESGIEESDLCAEHALALHEHLTGNGFRQPLRLHEADELLFLEFLYVLATELEVLRVESEVSGDSGCLRVEDGGEVHELFYLKKPCIKEIFFNTKMNRSKIAGIINNQCMLCWLRCLL